ncbi:hypothetical protein ANCCEY_03386 [Ancylostoma ceylanicum]|uniref:Lysozyme n=1 Tax=Ancylostoma ceylanicum TaxID=53326 RepID=A0A0D6M0D9_9BILA|nr:hypothetical protein ANCCEY_03386 [Ancylostoma ceylanicum]
MQVFVIVCSLALICFASPVFQQQEASSSDSFVYAVDVADPVTVAQFQCIRNSSYNVAFIKGYSSAGEGQVDWYVPITIQNADAAGLKTEVYMSPQPRSTKTGAQQFDEMYGRLRNNNINIKTIWIQQYNLNTGIYTCDFDWNDITGGGVASNTMLWYWNSYGPGPANESPANFNDFRPFGGWTSSPAAKQFGKFEYVCDVPVNRDIYSVFIPTKTVEADTQEKSKQIIVGDRGAGTVFSGKAQIKK